MAPKRAGSAAKATSPKGWKANTWQRIYGRRVLARRVASSLAVFAILAIAPAYFFVQRTLPTINGTLRGAGLVASVEVLRDGWGVPHIYGQNLSDVFFAQGFVTAQDRLWQMELFRRVGRGTLSEIFGRTALDDDRLLRTLGLKRVAQQEFAQLDSESRQILESYAAGVKAFVATHRDRLPLEFTILGFTPEPWTPVDSLIFVKVMALDLNRNWRQELIRAKLLGRFGVEALQELAPTYPSDAPIVVPNEVSLRDFAGVSLGEPSVLAHPFGSGFDMGSNNWVIAGSRSATGRPMLANDPHLGVQMPALWYEVHLNVAGNDGDNVLDIAGASLPGLPGVVIGHNDHIAWGVTNLAVDVQDLYVERINPENPTQYLFQSLWQDMQVLDDEIKVRGEEQPAKLRVLVTRHGPLLNGVVRGLGAPVALRWTALEPAETFRALVLLNRARDWDQFRAALRHFAGPSQNFVYADVAGNIGYQAQGTIPIRANGEGLLPVPGWTGEYEWVDYIPFDKLPSVYNPEQGYLFTANNRVVDGRYPYFLSHDWNPGYRARRLSELIEGSSLLTVDDFRRMQLDTKSLASIEIAALLTRLQPDDPPSKRALEYVSRWDGDLNGSSVAGAILETVTVKLLDKLYGAAMGEELFKEYIDTDLALPATIRILQDEHSFWLSNVRTAAQPDRDEVIIDSLRDAVAELRARLGSEMATWRWERLHTVTFGHPLGKIFPLDRLFNLGPFELGGDRNTLNQTAYKPSKSFDVSQIASLREIVDLGDFDRSLLVHTTGQSGQPLSPRFGDMAELWRRGEYHPMLFSRERILEHRPARLLLVP